MIDTQKYLDPLAPAKGRSPQLQARLIVEGFLSGMHKSPYHGFSVEFAEHREYVAGDDLKHLDWKGYGRTGRVFLTKHERAKNTPPPAGAGWPPASRCLTAGTAGVREASRWSRNTTTPAWGRPPSPTSFS